jgi:hypothetical protein
LSFIATLACADFDPVAPTHESGYQRQHSFQTGEFKMGAEDDANALSKDIIDLLNRGTATREKLVALAIAAGLVIKQWYKPIDRDEAVQWFAWLVKEQIRILSSQSEEND